MKKIVFVFLCSLMVLTSCATKEGKVVDITATQAVDKIKKKETFLLIVSLDTCPHCQDLKNMLKKEISNHDASIYRVELKTLPEDELYADVGALKKYLSNPSQIPHMYYIEKGEEKDEDDGYDKDNPDLFWDFIEKNS